MATDLVVLPHYAVDDWVAFMKEKGIQKVGHRRQANAHQQVSTNAMHIWARTGGVAGTLWKGTPQHSWLTAPRPPAGGGTAEA
jgi:hypothetical protein